MCSYRICDENIYLPPPPPSVHTLHVQMSQRELALSSLRLGKYGGSPLLQEAESALICGVWGSFQCL